MYARFLLSALLLMLPLGSHAAGYQIETVAEGLNHPWSLAFLPDGDVLVTERAGRLRVIREGRLLEQPVSGLPAIHVAGQGGLMEVLVDPDFASNQRLFLTFVHGERRGNATRLISARLRDGELQQQQVLFTASPLKNTSVHHGGRLLWLGDGSLLLTLGDGFNFRERAQALDDHYGTIVRIGVDGSVPADNPFVGRDDALPEIWSYGHRNVQGIVLDTRSGEVIAHEHGPRGGDEINLIRPGSNYGWPLTSHGIDYSGAMITPYTTRPGIVDPLLVWTPSIAPAGMTLYQGSQFPQWQGDLLVSALAGRHVARVRRDDSGTHDVERLFEELGERIRDIRTASDGSLWLLTDARAGKVLRVTAAE